jgi:hypothetical protein
MRLAIQNRNASRVFTARAPIPDFTGEAEKLARKILRISLK